MSDHLTNRQERSYCFVQYKELYTVQADVYDLIYFVPEKYVREVDFILRYSDLEPTGTRILDVACGTGSHAALLAEKGYDVVGLDLNIAMLQQAKRKCPHVHFLVGDMRSFCLKTNFDLVMCMYGAINYLESSEQLTLALTNFYHHLKPGGVLVIETRWSKNLPRGYWVEHHGETIILMRWLPGMGQSNSDLYLLAMWDSSRGRFLVEAHNFFNQDPFVVTEAMKNTGFEQVEIFEDYDLDRPFVTTTSEYRATIVGRKPLS